jgi:predicted metal-binding membrane protein
LLLGYLGAWAAFGLLAHGALHALAGNAFLIFTGWVIGEIVLGLAGAFQFSSLKYRCLDKCRAPFSFLNEHWGGADVRRQSFKIGVHHGMFCVGCC